MKDAAEGLSDGAKSLAVSERQVETGAKEMVAGERGVALVCQRSDGRGHTARKCNKGGAARSPTCSRCGGNRPAFKYNASKGETDTARKLKVGVQCWGCGMFGHLRAGMPARDSHERVVLSRHR